MLLGPLRAQAASKMSSTVRSVAEGSPCLQFVSIAVPERVTVNCTAVRMSRPHVTIDLAPLSLGLRDSLCERDPLWLVPRAVLRGDVMAPWFSILLCIVGLQVASGCGSIEVSTESVSGGFGDSVCDPVETWDNCPDDCPEPALCGDGACQPGEAQRCAQDCGGAASGALSGDGALNDGEACDCGGELTTCTSGDQDILGRLEGGPVLTALSCEDADPARPYGDVRCVDCNLRLQGCSDTH